MSNQKELTVEGKLFTVLPEQTGTGKNGNWVKQDFVIETIDQYPKKICITAWGDKTDVIKGLKHGDTVKASINIESREYNGKWYAEIKAWKIEVVGTQQSPASVPAPTHVSFNLNNENDLPF
jgi:hypothetical protein